MNSVPTYRVPFNRATKAPLAAQYVAEVLESGMIAGDGVYTKRCSKFLEKQFQVPSVMLTTSCTSALEMSALLLEIAPGDEFVVPSFTFSSTAAAFTRQGATPVFADIRRDTLNLDERQLPSLITERTKAVIVVHYAGVGCEMSEILAICKAAGIPVVEDNAHGLYGKYRGRWLGTFGELATQSFHETKNFTCGEGGALLINDPSFIERSEIIREKGTDRTKFRRGQVDKYTWVDAGSSFLPSEVLAAMLWAQLEEASVIQSKRQGIWDTYYRELREWARAHDVELPHVPADCEQAYHMFYMLCPTVVFRTRLIRHLAKSGILAVSHYEPLSRSPFGIRLGGAVGMCPISEDVSERLLRLPFYTDMANWDLATVTSCVQGYSEI